jgi:hypothetical protein
LSTPTTTINQTGQPQFRNDLITRIEIKKIEISHTFTTAAKLHAQGFVEVFAQVEDIFLLWSFGFSATGFVSTGAT